MGTIPPPIPVQPLHYQFQRPFEPPTRPGLLVTLAVLCFLVGALTILASGITTVFWLTCFAKSPGPPPAPSFTPFPANALAPINEVTGAKGLGSKQRSSILDQLPLTGRYADDRRLMFEHLLAEQGQIVAPNGQLNIAPGQGKQPSIDKQDQVVEVRLAAGNLFLHAQRAFLETTNGQTYGVYRLLALSPPSDKGTWSNLAIQRAFDRIEQSGIKLTPLQKGVVTKLVKDSQVNPDMGDISSSYRVLREVRMVGTTLQFTSPSGANWYVLADGRHVNVGAVAGQIDPIAGTILPPPTPHRPFMAGNRAWMLALGLHCAFNTILGVGLIAIGIQLLSRSGRGVASLQYWCAAKYLIVLLEVIWSLLLMRSMDGDGSQPTLPFDISAGIRGMWLGLLFQIIFPTAALLTLCFSRAIPHYLRATGRATTVWTRSNLSIAADRILAGAAWLRPVAITACAILLITGCWHGFQSLQREQSIYAQTLHYAATMISISLSVITLLILSAANTAGQKAGER